MKPRSAVITAILIAVTLLTGCDTLLKQNSKIASQPNPKTIKLRMKPQVYIGTGDYTDMQFLVHNVDSVDFPGDKTFNIKMKLFNEAENVLDSTEFRRELGRISSGQIVYPAGNRIVLTPGKYRLSIEAPPYSSAEINFTIVKRNGRPFISEQWSNQTTSNIVKTAPQTLRSPSTAQLSFDLKVSIGTYNQTEIILQVHNTGAADFKADENFNETMELSDEAGNRLSRLVNHYMISIPSGQTTSLKKTRGALPPGKYKIIYSAPPYGSTGINFTIVKRDGRLFITKTPIQQ